MLRLHILRYNAYEVVAQTVEVNVAAEGGAEERKCLLGIVPVAVEVAVNEVLHTAAHDESRAHSRRGSARGGWPRSERKR